MEYKTITDYAGLDFEQIDNLDIFTYWQLLRDAVIYNAAQTEKGRDWLERCWVAEQKEPDRKTLRELFGSGVSS